MEEEVNLALHLISEVLFHLVSVKVRYQAILWTVMLQSLKILDKIYNVLWLIQEIKCLSVKVNLQHHSSQKEKIILGLWRKVLKKVILRML